jgi:polyhydroxyalkanoate synthesis regulator phasin
MVLDIDQFGRNTSKNNTSSLNKENSKKILDSLAEIKNQLENKDYIPNVDDSSTKIKISSSKNKSDFDELKSKIESLEKKLNFIDSFLSDKSKNFEVNEPISQKVNGNLSIFHQIDNQSTMQQNKSLLVLENGNDLHKSNFNLFRFIMTINFLFLVLIGLIVNIKNIPLKDILKIFYDFS